MFGFKWMNNKKQKEVKNSTPYTYTNNNNINNISPSSSYDVETASYLKEKKLESNNDIVIELNNDIVIELNNELNNEEILEKQLLGEENKTLSEVLKSNFPVVPPIIIDKNKQNTFNTSNKSSPINQNKPIVQQGILTKTHSQDNLSDLDESVINLKLYNETLEKINSLKKDLHNLNEIIKDFDVDEDTQKEEENLSIDTDNFQDYIIKDSIKPYSYNSYYCQFLWSGIEHLDHWELQRKLNKEHAKQIMNEMREDYKKKNNFIFYDVIHLAIKSDGNPFVLDGQHRLVAYYNLYLKNKYPIQKVPAVIWNCSSEDEFLEIYEKINQRVPFDVTPFNKKILDIIFQLDNHFGKKGLNIWGKRRPKIDKALFIAEMDTNDAVHKLDADTIVKKIIDINVNIRGLPRSKRTDVKVPNQVHLSAEEIDFFLGYDKNLSWIHQITL